MALFGSACPCTIPKVLYDMGKTPFLASAHSMKDTPPIYTRQQLSLRNGSDREECWVAYKGVIYDIGFSRHWRGGIHYGHWSGQDLTEELQDAPHMEEVFLRCEIVGILSEEK